MSPSEAEAPSDLPSESVAPRPGILVKNQGEPFHLPDVNLHAISAEAALGGNKVKVWTRGRMLSNEAIFHRVAQSLISAIEYCARQVNIYPPLYRASTILLVMKPDNTGELWVDAAAVINESLLKRSAVAGSIIFANDIADITGMWFPFVEIGSEDRIVVLFREGFRFGLFFDFNSNRNLNIEAAKRDLGMLQRQMSYADLYSVLANEAVFGRMVEAGWFPFIEIMTGEFQTLSSDLEAGFPLETSEAEVVAKFTEERLDHMFERWMSKPHFKEREKILHSGIKAYKDNDSIACLKIALTEIEGVIAEAYFLATGQHTRSLNKLLRFATETAVKRAGGEDTLFFPKEFAHYLQHYTYADSTRQSASRNAVGHGRAKAEQYTQTRALQALLTLDQFAFYS